MMVAKKDSNYSKTFFIFIKHSLQNSELFQTFLSSSTWSGPLIAIGPCQLGLATNTQPISYARQKLLSTVSCQYQYENDKPIPQHHINQRVLTLKHLQFMHCWEVIFVSMIPISKPDTIHISWSSMPSSTLGVKKILVDRVYISNKAKKSARLLLIPYWIDRIARYKPNSCNWVAYLSKIMPVRCAHQSVLLELIHPGVWKFAVG